MELAEIEQKFSEQINAELLPAIRKYIVSSYRGKYVHSEEYKKCPLNERDALIKRQIQKWYHTTNSLRFSFYTCYALKELVERERKIREFVAHDYFKVWAKYYVDEVEFVAFYPSAFDASTIKEMEDCLADLMNSKNHHMVHKYKNQRREKEPPEPITTAQLQFSGVYIFGFKPHETLHYADLLYKAGLITNPITSGWYIEDDVIEEMISHLNGLYNNDESMVLQSKRAYEDKKFDRSTQRAIRPIKFMSDYVPSEIESTVEFKSIHFEHDKERKNTIKLYDYIYRFTLATQMTASVYDSSLVELEVGSRKLKANANFIIEEYDYDMEQMIKKDGWENLAGELFKKRESALDSFEKIVVLPIFEESSELIPLDVNRSVISKKRPPRFGTGRYIVQVLEANRIGNPSSYDDIILSLTDTKLVYLDDKMLLPSEMAMLSYEWMEKYCKDLTEIERMRDFEDKWMKVANEEISANSVLQEFLDVLMKAQSEAGFVNEDSLPSEAQIRQLQRVARHNGLSLADSVFKSRKEVEKILNQYPMPEEVLVGRCPKCNASVYQKEWQGDNDQITISFACEKRIKKGVGCNFVMYDDTVKRYFGDKGYQLYTLEERAKMLTNILSKQMNKERGFRVDGLIDKNRKPYNARIWLETYKDKVSGEERWGFGLKFINTRG